MADLIVLGWTLHLIADLLLQNAWMANNKANLKHPAAWVHGGIHFAAMWLIFPWWMALLLMVIHMLVDTRIPLVWWRKFFRQSAPESIMPTFAFWQDQALHLICITGAAWLLARF